MGTDHSRNTTLGSGRWLRVKNTSGEDMPPCAVCWIDGLTAVGNIQTLEAKKPDGSSQHSYAICGFGGIPNNGTGLVTTDFPAYAAYDATGAVPAVGDVFGPVAGNWRLRSSGIGYRCLSAGTGGLVMVREIGGAEGQAWSEIEGVVATVEDGGGDFTKGDATFKMKVGTTYGPVITDADVDDVVTVRNRPGFLTAYIFEGLENYSCHAFYDYENELWIVRWVECGGA